MMLTDMPITTAGGGFPWGLLIIGLILYFLWQKGVFDGRGRHGRWHDGGGYGPGNGLGYGPPRGPEGPVPGPGQGSDFGLRGPRDLFEDWHRQAHESESAQAQPQQPAAPVTQAAPATPPHAPEAPAQGTGETPR
jgi:hypothetical protein